MDFSAIHKFDFAGDKLLLDVNSGSVHLLGPLTDGLLREGERLGSLTAAAGLLAAEFGPEETGEALSQLERLIGEGLLFSAQPPEPEALPPTWLKSLCLNISHDCDLRCRYCFASGGDFGGGRRNMSFETARKALDMLLRESGPRPFCEVDFFGGEPLLNLETVKKTVAYGKEAAAAAGKKIKITFTTNALALSGETVDWLNGEGLSVVLSHDGRPETHDAMRRLPGGGKSYETINRHIKSFVASRPQGNYYIRGTYTNKNLDFCRDVEHWLEQGFREVSLEPVVAEPLFAGASWALTEEHLP
ncbi:MAG: radical SAM protein, partial [Clostridiales bacterium]|nr:radical SAM protein [Clostridiales bacterium]